MSFHESDISWLILGQIVKDWAGSSAQMAQVQPLEGGVINTTLCLTLADGTRAVVKISPHRVNRDYRREAHQLDCLRELGVPTPRVHQCKIGSLDDPHSYVLMEYIDGIDLAAAKQRCTAAQFERLQEDLAAVVLIMHGQTSPVYQRLLPDEGPVFDTWPAFFRHINDPILHEALKSDGLTSKDRKQLLRIHERLEVLLAHDDTARLVHWDLWSTNVLARPDEKGNWRVCALLDPMCKFAHAEAELAYLDLFHTITPAFTRAYHQKFRTDEAYHRVRKDVYQLYSLIDHVSLFGHDYVKPMLAAMEKIRAEG